jgi:uncharacterized protein YbjT (DUF2867 family)
MKSSNFSRGDLARSGGPVTRRILLAGATGYLGGFVLRELKKRGHFVRALARSPERITSADPDEVTRAEITRPETLVAAGDGMECVFSSIGITRQHDGLTWRDVDYQGNLNLLRAARAAGVSRFVYVSLFDGARLRCLDIVAAHEDFVDELKASGLEWIVIRPTGYFSDLKEVYDMAGRGRVYLFGRGEHRVNPIHGEDLASVCADAIEAREARREVDSTVDGSLRRRAAASVQPAPGGAAQVLHDHGDPGFRRPGHGRARSRAVLLRSGTGRGEKLAGR